MVSDSSNLVLLLGSSNETLVVFENYIWYGRVRAGGGGYKENVGWSDRVRRIEVIYGNCLREKFNRMIVIF